MTIRELPAPADGKRVETGPVRFGDDWTGTFLRGDDCAGYGMMLESLLRDFDRLAKHMPDNEVYNAIALCGAEGLLDLLRSSNEFPPKRTTD